MAEWCDIIGWNSETVAEWCDSKYGVTVPEQWPSGVIVSVVEQWNSGTVAEWCDSEWGGTVPEQWPSGVIVSVVEQCRNSGRVVL